MGKPVMPRLLAMVTKTDTCWLFNGTLVKGYGQICVNCKMEMAQRSEERMAARSAEKQSETIPY